MNTAGKYHQACKEFLSQTSEESYLSTKRSRSDTLSPSTSFKRPRFTSTPLQYKTKAARNIFASTSGSVSSKWDTIITAIKARQYRRAIQHLYNASPATKRHFVSVAVGIVRKEVKSLSTENFPLAKNVDIPSIQEFSWENTLNMAEQSAPLLFGMLKGAVTTKANENTLVRGNRVQLKPKIGTALAFLLHAKYPQSFKFLPTLISVQFWRGRLKRETMSQLSRLGICLGPNATLSAIDRIRSDFDAAALRLKEAMKRCLSPEVQVPEAESPDLSYVLSQTCPNIDEEISELPEDNDDTVLYSEGNETILDISYPEEEMIAEEETGDDDDEDDDDGDDEDTEGDDRMIEEEECAGEVKDVEMSAEEDVIETETSYKEVAEEIKVATDDKEALPLGFTMCWDNVGKKVITRRPNENVKNRYINMALGYIAVNRVPSTHLPWKNENLIKAANIPIASFIPGEAEFRSLRGRMQVIVGRMLTRHIPWYKEHFSKYSLAHIVHEHTLESTYKSLLINLGVFNEEPSSTQGAIGIYTRLQNYVPVIDGKPCQVVVFGDGLSCERGNDAQRARSNGLDPLERLEGLEPAAQEFHKEMLLLQDYFDDFFKGSSAADRGTLCQIKNMFNYRQVKADISDNFAHSWELMCLITETFVCLLAMEIQGFTEHASRPATAPDGLEDASEEVKSDFFKKICEEVVKTAWHKLDVERLQNDDGTGPPIFCCGEDLHEDVIGCESRSNCPNGEFFHYSCAGVDPENIVTPWFCSPDCRNQINPRYQYCVCKQDLGTDEPMIGCSAEDRCLKDEWYHMRCLGIDPKKKHKGEWYCSTECKTLCKGKEKGGKKKKRPEVDSKRSYSVAAVWRGLNLLCRRDSVREADGEAMMAFWKLDLVHFFGHKHPKYVILAHRLLAAINGWVPERVKQDLIHNRTVNYGGGIGRNLPLDFMNEILNRLFKDLLESAKGRYTDTTVNRCSQIVGPLGESLDVVFDTNVIENEIYRHRRRDVNRDTNVTKLIDVLYMEKIFSCVPGRKHNAFQDFFYDETPMQAEKFTSKMKQLCKRLDRRRAVVLDN